jgi:zinc protease
MIPSFPSPETISRIDLPNGVIVLAYEDHSNPSVVMAGYLWAGALSESPEQAGLASFTSGMLMRGTESRTFGEINEALESLGAQLGFHSGMHTVAFGGKALAEDLDLLLDVLADCLQHPTFPAGQVQTLQGQILTDLQRRRQDTRRMARLTFDALLYPTWWAIIRTAIRRTVWSLPSWVLCQPVLWQARYRQRWETGTLQASFPTVAFHPE